MSSCFVVKLFGREQNSDQNSWNFSKFGFEHFWANLKCHSFLDFYSSEKCYWAFFSRTVLNLSRTLEKIQFFQIKCSRLQARTGEVRAASRQIQLSGTALFFIIVVKLRVSSSFSLWKSIRKASMCYSIFLNFYEVENIIKN